MAAAPARRDVGMNGAAAVHPFPRLTTALLTAGDISGQPAASQPSARHPFRDEPSAEAMRMNRKKGKGLGPCGKLGRPAWEGVTDANLARLCYRGGCSLSLSLSSLSCSRARARVRPKRCLRIFAICANSLVVLIRIRALYSVQSQDRISRIGYHRTKKRSTGQSSADPRGQNVFPCLQMENLWRGEGEGQVPDVTARVRARRRRSCRLSFVSPRRTRRRRCMIRKLIDRQTDALAL